MMSPTEREAYEAQATACLEAAATYREPLLRVAVRLTGNREAGMDLFQQNLLNCHDAIQRGGFDGEQYRFYLLRSLKNLYYKEARQPRHLPLPADMELAQPLPEAEAWTQLAAQVEAELQARFKAADRVAFRLHVAGYTCQDIAAMIGRRDRTWVWRRVKRVKRVLRARFRSAWEAED